MLTLKPKTWLNDEISNYLYKLLAKCDTELCKNDPAHQHTFFYNILVTRIMDERNTKLEGMYEYANARHWFDRYNIFKVDTIIIPINMDNIH